MSETITDLILKYSSDPSLFSNFLNKRIDTNIHCVYSGRITVAIQMYESTIDFKELNKAIVLEDYEKNVHIFKDMDKLIYEKFLKNFKNSIHDVKEICEYKRCILFPIGISFFDNYKGKIKFAGNHASLAILDQKENMIYIIDSDNIENIEKDLDYDEKKYEKYLCKKIKYCIDTITKQKNKIKFLDVRSPQSKTKDEYCIFWSLAITEELFKNYKDFNPSKTMKEFMKTYNTKKKLEKYIQNFILTSF
jgi:hypothetical protein